MSFQIHKTELQNAFDVLKSQAFETSNSWIDSVQKRFYGQFIDLLPKEFDIYINEFNKLDKSFESAEQTINGLRE